MTTDTAMLDFTIVPSTTPMAESDRLRAFDNLGFGTLFTDHMAVVQWDADKGWHHAEIKARAPFQIDPAASVLHYAQEIFEGMKAYKAQDGRITLFRPEENARRFNKSAIRMAMPEVPEELFLKAVAELVKIDSKWVPEGEGSLYLRPFMFATEAFLGVRPSRQYIFCVIASPVGPYFKGGSKPVTLWVSEHYTRAAPGGTGAAKCGGNYAASLLAQSEATSRGCDQVVFLDAAEHKWVEELGGMNVFFVMDDGTVVTPPLSGTILPGITRGSIIQLATENGLKVIERPYSFEEWANDARSGKLREAFACGTAAVVAAIGTVRHSGGEFVIGNAGTGMETEKLRNQLTGIQRGTVADGHGWVKDVASL
ncbi:branched-chain amino acid aminotransferase [Peteryoungia desertarenae]|uniref:Branched-chain-amino-acid aminotransferase n=1 Tax=Peteryoungia desertarenae TaxID=1813451 RepID=A0ABX6QLL6_9HYPH|nr:branched-chain amino acid aminotransferase [Peteryoungia desertarenae]QLF69425.1 branched-chain amino acid aminotransferase [Peteryoungia desertarenae]